MRRVLARAEHRGEVRLREVLELRALQGSGRPFPDASPVLTGAADIEVTLGSRDLVRWTSGSRAAAPRPVRTRARADRLVVAVSGVDGAGKSTLLAALERDLERCGLPVSRVWLRPGMGLGPLSALAQRVKRRRGGRTCGRASDRWRLTPTWCLTRVRACRDGSGRCSSPRPSSPASVGSTPPHVEWSCTTAM